MKRLFALLLPMVFAAATAAAQVPVASTACGPWVVGMTDDAFTVVWISTERSIGWVETAPDDGTSFYSEERPRYYEDLLGRHVVSRLHRVRVEGLKPGTAYRYRIYQQGVDDSGAIPVLGRTTASNVYSREPYRVRTFDAAADKCRFTVVNDIHGRDSIFRALTGDATRRGVDFVAFNGDMSNLMGSVEQLQEDYLTRAVELFATDTPVVVVRGNHETRGAASVEFMNLFPTPSGKPYYMFRNGPAAFLVLDCGEDKPDSDLEYGGLAAYDAHREREAEWLRQVVQSDEFRSAAVRIVFLHVPPEQKGWHGSRELMRLFVPLLNEAGVDLMLSAHLHRYGFVGAGERGNNFPILVNSNNERLDVEVTPSRIAVDVVDAAGKVTHRHEVEVKRR